MALIVSVSGVRGIVGDELTPEVAMRFAAAFGAAIGGDKMAVGRDSRPSGNALRHAVIAGLTGIGINVEDFGVLPTPTFGLLVRERGCAGGLQITASHNPAPYNGLKLFGGDGAVLTAQDGAEIQSAYQSGKSSWAIWNSCGSTTDATACWTRHSDRVLELVDVAKIRAAHFRIVLDANGGAGGPLGRHLLDNLGCDIVPVGCEPNGDFKHEPEPLPAHLQDIESIVRHHHGAIGAALDPDADRLVLIDESGRCLSEELTLALAVQQRLAKDAGPVVINLSTSRSTEEVAKAAGVHCYRSAVGEANVVAKMREVGALVGGEGNGGVIDPRVGWVRDPFIGIGLILELMAQTGNTLRQLADGLPRFVMRKEKFTIAPDRFRAALSGLRAKFGDARTDETDGVRFEWPDAWLHLRASNTEPVVRAIAEAENAARLDGLCQMAGVLLSPN